MGHQTHQVFIVAILLAIASRANLMNDIQYLAADGTGVSQQPEPRLTITMGCRGQVPSSTRISDLHGLHLLSHWKPVFGTLALAMSGGSNFPGPTEHVLILS